MLNAYFFLHTRINIQAHTTLSTSPSAPVLLASLSASPLVSSLVSWLYRLPFDVSCGHCYSKLVLLMPFTSDVVAYFMRPRHSHISPHFDSIRSLSLPLLSLMYGSIWTFFAAYDYMHTYIQGTCS
ncbi:unnamed protein product [Ceratitis capitata]|uniref:(Mediterranean fruit fly) hypothetical protein n=1 Tax=Ceratitis capitata TaxID=7213 RepID=A0A811UXY8_CERCA|nr:unnamed protein product [Ceratitis capitata]